MADGVVDEFSTKVFGSSRTIPSPMTEQTVFSGFTDCTTSPSVGSQLDEAALICAATLPTTDESEESMADVVSTASYTEDGEFYPLEEIYDCDDTPYDPIRQPKVHKVNEDVNWLHTMRTCLKPHVAAPETKTAWKKQETKPTWVNIANRHVTGATKKRKESPTREVFLDPRPSWLKDAKTSLSKARPVATKEEQTKRLKEHAPGSVGWLLVARMSLAETPTSQVLNPTNHVQAAEMLTTADNSQYGVEEDLIPPPLPASAKNYR